MPNLPKRGSRVKTNKKNKRKPTPKIKMPKPKGVTPKRIKTNKYGTFE